MNEMPFFYCNKNGRMVKGLQYPSFLVNGKMAK